MNSEKKLRDIRTLNLIACLWDGFLILINVSFFLFFFMMIQSPERSSDLEFPEQTTAIAFNLLGTVYSIQTVNTVLTLTFLFTLIGAATLFINVKHRKGLAPREYHRWEAANTVGFAFLELLSLNVIGFIAKLINASQICKYAEDINLFQMVKKVNGEMNDKRKKRKEEKNADLTEDEIIIKKKVARQSAFKVTRYTSIYLVLIIFAIFILVPFYWMILTSFKTFQESRAVLPSIAIPIQNFQWINIKFVIENMQFGVYIRNTLIVAVISTIGTIITTVLAAFAFARLDFKGREAIFSVLLMTMMIPGEIYIITNFTTVSNSANDFSFGWIGGEENPVGYFAAMILPFMTSVFYIFLLRQTFKQIPDSLYRAAKVDGCSDFKYLTRVMLPIAAPTIVTITILSLLGSWNAFLWPRQVASLVPTVGKKYWLISVALREESFVIDKGGGAAESMYNLQIGATALVTVPLLIVFMIFRKRIMSGVGRSGTKG